MKRALFPGALGRSPSCLLGLLLALASMAAGAGSARAELPASEQSAAAIERAEQLAAQAFAAYGRKEYGAAVLLYRQAYDAAPSADILFNIARIYDIGLEARTTAVTFYRQYVIDPDAEDDRLAIAFERLEVLEQAAASGSSARVSSAPPAAVVAPLPRARPVVAQPEPARAVAPDESWTAWRVGGIVAGTVGIVSLGIGAGFGVAALSDASTAREYCDGDVCSSQRGLDAVNAASKNASIATASFVIGGGLIAAGAALLWFEPEPAPRREIAGLSWSASVSDSELGLALSGEW